MPKQAVATIPIPDGVSAIEAFGKVRSKLIREEFEIREEIEGEFLNAVRDPKGKGIGAHIEGGLLHLRVIVTIDEQTRSIGIKSRYNSFVAFDTGDLNRFHRAVVEDVTSAM